MLFTPITCTETVCFIGVSCLGGSTCWGAEVSCLLEELFVSVFFVSCLVEEDFVSIFFVSCFLASCLLEEDFASFFFVSCFLVSCLLEESDKITDEMRNNSISPYELLVVLEKRKDISSKLKEKYRGNKEVREESELMEMLINYDGKLSILVDENFLREIFEMDGVAIISQKCNIYAISNVFDNSEREMKQVEVAKIACNFLDDLKNDIQEYKEAGDINYYGVKHLNINTIPSTFNILL